MRYTAKVVHGDSSLARQKNMRGNMDVRANRHILASTYYAIWVNPDIAS